MFWKKSKVYYKNLEEKDLIIKSGDLLGKVHGELSRNIKEGLKTKDLDKLAYQFIKDNNAVPSFLNYRDFPASLCISVNDTVVHGIPDQYELKDGDIVSIDCGVLLNGYHADSAFSYRVGNINEEKKRLLKITYESLTAGINAAKHGMRVGDVSYTIQNYVEKQGYSVVRELVGHGVGKYLHEEPDVPNFGKRGKGVKLIKGMVIAIEPMINLGKKEIYQLNDNWTVKTVDGKPSAHFEHTVFIGEGAPEILTTFKYISKDQLISG